MNKIFLIVFKIHQMSDKKAHFCYAHVCWWQNETELSTQFVCLILSHLLFFWLDWSIREAPESMEMSLKSGTGILHLWRTIWTVWYLIKHILGRQIHNTSNTQKKCQNMPGLSHCTIWKSSPWIFSCDSEYDLYLHCNFKGSACISLNAWLVDRWWTTLKSLSILFNLINKTLVMYTNFKFVLPCVKTST